MNIYFNHLSNVTALNSHCHTFTDISTDIPLTLPELSPCISANAASAPIKITTKITYKINTNTSTQVFSLLYAYTYIGAIHRKESIYVRITPGKRMIFQPVYSK